MGDSASTQAATRVNAEQASKRDAEADPPLKRGRLGSGREASDASTDRFRRGVWRRHACKRETAATREAPTVARTRQPGIREDQPGPAGWRRGP